MDKKYKVSGTWRTGVPKRMRRATEGTIQRVKKKTLAEELDLVRRDAAMAWDKCEERRKSEEALRAKLNSAISALHNIATDPHARANPQVYHNEWEEFAFQLVGYAREELGLKPLVDTE